MHPPTHLVIVEGTGPGDPELAQEMHRAALRTFAPRRVVQLVRAGGSAAPPAVEAMQKAASGTRGYLCVGASCRAPADSVAAWHETLGPLRTRG